MLGETIMSLSDLAAIGSLVSGVAVLVSLLFLYFQLAQMREQVVQTETNQRGANAVQFGAAASNFTLKLMEPQFAEVQRKLYRSDPSFSDAELFQAMNLVQTYLNQLFDTFALQKLSLIDEATAEARLNPVKLIFGQASVRAIWPMLKQNVTEESRRFVEDCIRSEPPRPPVDFNSIYKANLAKVDHSSGM